MRLRLPLSPELWGPPSSDRPAQHAPGVLLSAFAVCVLGVRRMTHAGVWVPQVRLLWKRGVGHRGPLQRPTSLPDIWEAGELGEPVGMRLPHPYGGRMS